MRSKDKELITAIERFIRNFTDNAGVSPTMQEVADGVGSSKATVQRYIVQMRKDGILDYSGYRTMVSTKARVPVTRVPLLGSVACGVPKFAEENIEEYLPLPLSLIGKGDFYILRAKGDSMIEAGINDGDLVIIRRQNTANEGQMVVALVDDEATLKRFYPEPSENRIRLHPENPNIPDIFVKSCEIQGIAVKVIKDLE